MFHANGFLIVIAMVLIWPGALVPSSVGQIPPGVPPGGGGNDPWVDAAGDFMSGPLDMGFNPIELGGQKLQVTQEQPGVLTFGGHEVCLDATEGCTGPAGPPGPSGAAGLSCWDLDGDSIADAGEDANGDGLVDAGDCQGAAGPPGPPGRSCWDADGDGVGDPEEDVNADGNYDNLDCQGPPGEAGNSVAHAFADLPRLGDLPNGGGCESAGSVFIDVPGPGRIVVSVLVEVTGWEDGDLSGFGAWAEISSGPTPCTGGLERAEWRDESQGSHDTIPVRTAVAVSEAGQHVFSVGVAKTTNSRVQVTDGSIEATWYPG